MKKPITTLTKDFVNLPTNLTYIVGYNRFVFLHTYILHTPETPIKLHFQQGLKLFLHYQKTSKEINIKKQEINIWQLVKNDLE